MSLYLLSGVCAWSLIRCLLLVVVFFDFSFALLSVFQHPLCYFADHLYPWFDSGLGCTLCHIVANCLLSWLGARAVVLGFLLGFAGGGHPCRLVW